jgi:hypothetical protein
MAHKGLGFLMDEGEGAKFALVLFLAFLAMYAVSRMLNRLNVFDDGSVRVALCGDMTLENVKVPLSKLLEASSTKVRVRNFLVNRATALRSVGEKIRTLDSIAEDGVSSADCASYIESLEYQKLLDARPTAVVIMLGAHDAAPENWCKSGAYGCTFRQVSD